jgi:hypothetical protein
MLCLIAGNHLEAERWARGQLLDESEWFFPSDPDELKSKSNFHVIVIGTAGYNVPPAYFERILHLAQQRGRIGRI